MSKQRLVLVLSLAASACVVPNQISATRPYASCTKFMRVTDSLNRLDGFHQLERTFSTGTGSGPEWLLLYATRPDTTGRFQLQQVHVLATDAGCVPNIQRTTSTIPRERE